MSTFNNINPEWGGQGQPLLEEWEEAEVLTSALLERWLKGDGSDSDLLGLIQVARSLKRLGFSLNLKVLQFWGDDLEQIYSQCSAAPDHSRERLEMVRNLLPDWCEMRETLSKGHGDEAFAKYQRLRIFFEDRQWLSPRCLTPRDRAALKIRPRSLSKPGLKKGDGANSAEKADHPEKKVFAEPKGRNRKLVIPKLKKEEPLKPVLNPLSASVDPDTYPQPSHSAGLRPIPGDSALGGAGVYLSSEHLDYLLQMTGTLLQEHQVLGARIQNLSRRGKSIGAGLGLADLVTLSKASKFARKIQTELVSLRMRPIEDLVGFLSDSFDSALHQQGCMGELHLETSPLFLDWNAVEPLLPAFARLIHFWVPLFLPKSDPSFQKALPQMVIQLQVTQSLLRLVFQGAPGVFPVDSIIQKAIRLGKLSDEQTVPTHPAALGKLAIAVDFHPQEGEVGGAVRPGVGRLLKLQHTILDAGGQLQVAIRGDGRSEWKVDVPLSFVQAEYCLVLCAERWLAIPLDWVEDEITISSHLIQRSDRGEVFQYENEWLAFYRLSNLFGASCRAFPGPGIVARHGKQRIVLLVDQIQGRQVLGIKNFHRQPEQPHPLLDGCTTEASSSSIFRLDLVPLFNETGQEKQRNLPQRFRMANVMSSKGLMKRDFSSFRVLILDHRKEAKESYSVYLEHVGADSERVETPMEVEKALELKKFDVLILYVDEPLRRVESLLQKLRKQASCNKLPILITSPRMPEDVMAEMMEWDATGFLEEPYTMDLLQAAVEQCLRGR